MTEYITKAGVRLQVGRVPRERIDHFAASHPIPTPPTREVEVWGGLTEEVPVFDDPGYLLEMRHYHYSLGNEQVALVADAVELPANYPLSELEELRALTLVEGDGKSDLLRYIVLADREDLEAVVELVLYNSTVTVRGIREAEDEFAVTWRGKPVMAWHVPNAGGGYSDVFEARRAAQFVHLAWLAFCATSGAEQSKTVAFYRLDRRLEWLMTTQR